MPHSDRRVQLGNEPICRQTRIVVDELRVVCLGADVLILLAEKQLPFDINFEVQQRPSRDIAFLRGSEPKAFSGSAV